jgi:hypothetical protein
MLPFEVRLAFIIFKDYHHIIKLGTMNSKMEVAKDSTILWYRLCFIYCKYDLMIDQNSMLIRMNNFSISLKKLVTYKDTNNGIAKYWLHEEFKY